MLETQMWVNGGGVVRVGDRNACMSQLLTPSISFIGQVWRRGDTESIVWIGLKGVGGRGIPSVVQVLAV